MAILLNKFKPIDVIAILTIAGGLTLKFLGFDGTVGTILTTIVVFYFGKKEIYDKVKPLKSSDAKVETVEETIKRIAKEEGVDPALAVRVARCESGLNPSAVNVNKTGSKDRGLFQWNNYYHPEITDLCAFDIECSARSFCKAVNGGNLYWWNASKKCWDR